MTIDRIIGAAALLLAAVYLYATTHIPTLEIGDPLGPKAFPILLGIVLIAAAILLFIETLNADPVIPEKAAAGSRRHLWLIAGVTAWTALYFGLFDRAGYLIATVVYLLAMMAVFNPGKWVANVLTTVLWAVGSYVLFVKILGVSLPPGILKF
jgi:putative tricarboxylic transport membrane protein